MAREDCDTNDNDELQEEEDENDIKFDVGIVAFKKNYDLYKQQLAARERIGDKKWKQTTKKLTTLHYLKQLVEKRKKIENLMFYLAFFGIILMILENEIYWVYWIPHIEEDVYLEPTPCYIIKWLLLVSTLLLLRTLVQRYEIHCEIKICAHELPSTAKFYHLSSGKMLWIFFIEALFCMFHIPPGVYGSWKTLEYQFVATFNPISKTYFCPNLYIVKGNFCYRMFRRNIDQFGIIMLLRFYLFGRVLRNFTGFYDREVVLLGSLNNVKTSSSWFTIKSLFRKYPARVTIGALLLDWFVTAVALNFTERGANEQIDTIFDSFWLTIVTMSTVGYGDISPSTTLGRIIIVLGGVFGGLITSSILTAVLVDSLAFSTNEKKVLNIIQSHQYTWQRFNTAANLIQKAWKYYRFHNNNKSINTNTYHSTFKLILPAPIATLNLYGASSKMRWIRFAKPITASRSSMEILSSCRYRLDKKLNKPKVTNLLKDINTILDNIQYYK